MKQGIEVSVIVHAGLIALLFAAAGQPHVVPNVVSSVVVPTQVHYVAATQVKPVVARVSVHKSPGGFVSTAKLNVAGRVSKPVVDVVAPEFVKLEDSPLNVGTFQGHAVVGPTVVTGGFGIAAGSGGGVRSGAKQVQLGTFGDAGRVVVASKPREALLYPPVVRVSPKPRIYTAVDGEVVLRVTFGADGQLRVLGVVKSMGAVQDAEAVRIARLVQFTPAERAGEKLDFTTLYHVLIQRGV
jgi:TonB family protein